MTERKYILDFGWQVLIKEMGLSVQDVLLKAGLPTDLIHHERLSLNTAQYYAMWEGMASLVNDPLFPLKIVQAFRPENFSPPLFASLCSPNMNVALDRLKQYKPLIGPMALTIEKDEQQTVVILSGVSDQTPLPPTIIAMELCFFVNLARIATREHIVPLSIHTKAPLNAQSVYEEFFGTKITPSPFNGFILSAEDAEMPFLTANDAMWSVFEPTLRTRLKDLGIGATFSDRVRACLTETIAGGVISKEDVAKKLAVSPRTLQRRLKEENTSFQQELTKLREELARHYLSNSGYSSAEISFMLGYDDPTSFFRAFQNWTGKTPDAVRQEARPPLYIKTA